MEFNGIWISEGAREKLVQGLIQSRYFQNHLGALGGNYYINGIWVCSDKGANSNILSLHNVAHLTNPFCLESDAYLDFQNRLSYQTPIEVHKPAEKEINDSK